MNITHNLDIEIPHLHEQFIGGDWAKAANPNIVPVISPATEEVLTETHCQQLWMQIKLLQWLIMLSIMAHGQEWQ